MTDTASLQEIKLHIHFNRRNNTTSKVVYISANPTSILMGEIELKSLSNNVNHLFYNSLGFLYLYNY